MRLWEPTQDSIANSNLTRFVAAVAPHVDADEYGDLHRWSIERPDEFWLAVWRFCSVRGDLNDTEVVRDFDRMPGASWFPDAQLNFAENLLGADGDDEAVVFVSERGERRALTWRELRCQVASVAEHLAALGVGPGDRVAGWLANLPETVVAMLATTKLGAIWSSCSPDFGERAVLDRFGQINPKVLFAADSYAYAGKTIDCLDRLAGIARALPDLAAVIVVPYLRREPALDSFPSAMTFDAVAHDTVPLEFERFPFSQPVYILYTSGTTGVPKSIVHGAGGTLLQHRKEHVLHTDVKPADRVFYFTTCGWMMWNWLVSCLASGATIVLYEGMPLHPDPGVLWRLAEAERLNVFGTSAKYLSALQKTGYAPTEHHDLTALRCILSTGSPLAGATFDYVYSDIKEDVQLSSIAGGTDLISCFALGNPTLPVYRGELQCRGLGMAVEVFDEHGQAVVGKKGELVCTAPFPSMPVAFWNDPDGQKYFDAYFARFPEVWCHGDYAELTERGGLILYGRSDTVLNPGGVRIGTAEIYRVVDKLPQIMESIVIGQDWEDDIRVVLFVRLQPNCTLDESLRETIRTRLRAEASPRHVPAKIVEVDDIPRTQSGKIVEVAVRDVIHGREVLNRDSLANPEALDQFRDLAELES